MFPEVTAAGSRQRPEGCHQDGQFQGTTGWLSHLRDLQPSSDGTGSDHAGSPEETSALAQPHGHLLWQKEEQQQVAKEMLRTGRGKLLPAAAQIYAGYDGFITVTSEWVQ